MSLIGLLIVILVLGLIYWLISAVIPLPEPFGKVILVIFVIIVIVLLLNFAGLVGTPFTVRR